MSSFRPLTPKQFGSQAACPCSASSLKMLAVTAGGLGTGGPGGCERTPFDNYCYDDNLPDGALAVDQRKQRQEDPELVGVLQRVSEMTIADPRWPSIHHQHTPILMGSATPTASLGSLMQVCQTPSSTGEHSSYNHHCYYTTPASTTGGGKVFFPPSHHYPFEASKRSSPLFFATRVRGGHRPPHSSTNAAAVVARTGARVFDGTEARVFDAPPLPSSPELSTGRHSMSAIRRIVPPQFSPIATLTQSTALHHHQHLFRPLPSPPSDSAGASHVAHTPMDMITMTTGDLGPAASTRPTPPAPPAMPRMDTPEQAGRRLVFPMKMRRINPATSGIVAHPSLPFCG